jgi:tetrachloro-p-hydroquinone reductive dehalogenase
VSAEDVRLYHFPLSYESQIVRLVLCEKAVDWRGRVVNLGSPYENYSPWYLRLNPRGRVPTLEHRGLVLTDALEIARYLDERFPGPSLLPEDAAQRRTVDEWIGIQQGLPNLDLTYAALGGILRGAMLHDFARRRRKLARLRQRVPDLDRLFDPLIEDLDDWEASIRDTALRGTLIAELEQAMRDLETRLDGRCWILGDRYSLADVVWGVLLARLDLIRLGHLWERGRLPNVEAYYRRFEGRPCFGRAGVVNRHDPRVVVPAVLRASWLVLAGLVVIGGLGLLL